MQICLLTKFKLLNHVDTILMVIEKKNCTAIKGHNFRLRFGLMTHLVTNRKCLHDLCKTTCLFYYCGFNYFVENVGFVLE